MELGLVPRMKGRSILQLGLVVRIQGRLFWAGLGITLKCLRLSSFHQLWILVMFITRLYIIHGWGWVGCIFC